MAEDTRPTVWTAQREARESLLGDAPVPSEVAEKIKNQASNADAVKKRQEPYSTPVNTEALRHIVV